MHACTHAWGGYVQVCRWLHMRRGQAAARAEASGARAAAGSGPYDEEIVDPAELDRDLDQLFAEIEAEQQTQEQADDAAAALRARAVRVAGAAATQAAAGGGHGSFMALLMEGLEGLDQAADCYAPGYVAPVVTPQQATPQLGSYDSPEEVDVAQVVAQAAAARQAAAQQAAVAAAQHVWLVQQQQQLASMPNGTFMLPFPGGPGHQG
jgi:hypothetical protein